MRTLMLFTVLLANAQSFDVTAIRRNTQPLGPDHNNQFSYTADGFSAHNITLARLIAEAYRLQLSQISGPSWINSNEYDIDARAAVTKEQMFPMLRTLLAERFQLKQHRETRTIRAYELTVDRGGLKTPTAKTGYHFTGDMRQFADLIGVHLSIPEGHDPTRPTMASGPPVPVIDQTGLAGTFDFYLPLGPGTDLFTLVREQLGLRLESRKRPFQILVVASALQTPTEN